MLLTLVNDQIPLKVQQDESNIQRAQDEYTSAQEAARVAKSKSDFARTAIKIVNAERQQLQ